jgi:hypothetical protein
MAFVRNNSGNRLEAAPEHKQHGSHDARYEGDKARAEYSKTQSALSGASLGVVVSEKSLRRVTAVVLVIHRNW